MAEAMAIQRESISRMTEFLGPVDDGPVKREKIKSTINFKNPKAKQFLVDGTKLPEGIPFFSSYTSTINNLLLV